MTYCTHDLTEREVACADGMCPMCLAAEVERLRGLLRECEPWAEIASGELGRRVTAALAGEKPC